MERDVVKVQTIDRAQDNHLPLSVVAIKRAAMRAREIAELTNTALVIAEDGKCKRIHPETLEEME